MQRSMVSVASLPAKRVLSARIARAAAFERPEQVVAEEVAARVDDDEGGLLAAALGGKAPVDRRF